MFELEFLQNLEKQNNTTHHHPTIYSLKALLVLKDYLRQLCEDDNKIHCIIYFKRVNCMACERHLNSIVVINKTSMRSVFCYLILWLQRTNKNEI